MSENGGPGGIPAGPVPDAAAPDGGATPAPSSPGPARRPRRLAHGVTLAVLIAVGIAGVGAGGAALAAELTRSATKAEVAAAVQAEIASRWQRLPAGKIFPATVSYTEPDMSAASTARLVGIAPAAGCGAALDPAVAGLLRRSGCVTVLRATYTDASGTLAATVGVAVMANPSAATGAVADSVTLPDNSGVQTFGLPGTVADQFGNAQRLAFGVPTSAGPYVFLYAAGYTDGLASAAAGGNPALADLGNGLLAGLKAVLTAHGSGCEMKDIRC